MNLISNLPFSYIWIIRRMIGDAVTVLDLGCGEGDFTEAVSTGKNWKITGVELYPLSIKKARERRIYQAIIKSDITKLPKTLKKYDVVLASQVIEHLPKKKGEIFIKQIEKFAKKRIVITTPVGFVPFHQIEKGSQDKNPLQKHLSGWSIEEMEQKGFKVYGQGVGFLYRSDFIKALPGFLFPVISLVSFLFAPFIYLTPRFAMYMIAVKNL